MLCLLLFTVVNSDLIRVHLDTKALLDEVKVIPTESYDSVIRRIISKEVVKGD